uniref:Ribosomal protein L15 n=1 Tax=Piliocolobus tephrosceles TaxID=591936 RepID=A0A8C9HQM1_9PRIM
MGAYPHIQELWRKKQSHIMRFLLRVSCWQYHQLSALHRAPHPTQPDKVRRLGCKAKQGYIIYRIRVRRGGRKRPVPKGATNGKPVHHGVNQLKLSSLIHSIKLSEEILTPNESPNQAIKFHHRKRNTLQLHRYH